MRSYSPRLNIDALILSVNDVLIDVSRSYREVACKTVQLYLEQAIGLTPSKEALLMPDEATILQRLGSFTDYRDLATAFLIYFIELLPSVPVPTFPSKFHVPAIIAYLQLAKGGIRVGVEALREKKDVVGLAQRVATAGGGLKGADAALPKTNRHLLVSSGSITRANLVGRIFQELYLGADLFERTYEQPALIIQSTGYTEHEALLIEIDILAEISQKVSLAAISSSPRFEVEHALKAMGVEQYFKAVVSQDDMLQARGKPLPDPWLLLEAASRVRPTPARSAYAGATPGDVQAAKAANETAPFTAIASLAGAHDKETLRQEFEMAKANIILGHPNHLKELIVD